MLEEYNMGMINTKKFHREKELIYARHLLMLIKKSI
jgi:hypothetical protein